MYTPVHLECKIRTPPVRYSGSDATLTAVLPCAFFKYQDDPQIELRIWTVGIVFDGETAWPLCVRPDTFNHSAFCKIMYILSIHKYT